MHENPIPGENLPSNEEKMTLTTTRKTSAEAAIC